MIGEERERSKDKRIRENGQVRTGGAAVGWTNLGLAQAWGHGGKESRQRKLSSGETELMRFENHTLAADLTLWWDLITINQLVAKHARI